MGKNKKKTRTGTAPPRCWQYPWCIGGGDPHHRYTLKIIYSFIVKLSILVFMKTTRFLQKFGKKIGLYFANRKPLSEENFRVVYKLKAHNPFKMRKSENALFFNGFQTVLKNPFKVGSKRGKFMSG